MSSYRVRLSYHHDRCHTVASRRILGYVSSVNPGVDFMELLDNTSFPLQKQLRFNEEYE